MSAPDTAASSEVEGLTPLAKRALSFGFLTLFIDLIGFSIIFPLFPAMLEYYHARETSGGLFSLLYSAINHLATFVGTPSHDAGVVVLFGGILGSLYSLLQFLCAPLYGSLSDRYGRRPVIIVSLCGLLLSYALWFVAGSFYLLVLSRLIGGVMSANISTVSAIVSDVTNSRTRSRGMAIIGIAFGIGFTLGPAFGGLSSLFNLAEHFPQWVAYGINPWSAAALIAFVLTFINLMQALFFLPETRPDSSHLERVERSVNPLKLFHTVEYPGVSRANFAYFLFLLGFSGMEFSLTFLAREKFGYTERSNAMLFLVIGFVLAMVQGGYVRRRAGTIGPRKMAIHGLCFVVPGLVAIGLAGSLHLVWLLYVGIVLIATGAAQTTPCMTSLVSLYTPPQEQGRIMGVFRSQGALARAVGPLLACVIYWRMGSSPAYYLGALLMLAPMFLTRSLPDPPNSHA